MDISFMNVEIGSENGTPGVNGYLEAKMDGSTPDCCVTLYNEKGKAIFSMGSDEVDAFCQALKTIAAD